MVVTRKRVVKTGQKSLARVRSVSYCGGDWRIAGDFVFARVSNESAYNRSIFFKYL